MTSQQYQRIGLLGFIAFLIISGIGMYVSYAVFETEYGTPENLKLLFPMEVILVLVGVIFVTKNLSWQAVGFGKLDVKNFLIWLAPLMLLVGAAIGFDLLSLDLEKLTAAHWEAYAWVGATTFLVGISEELMFRGVVLRSFMQTGSTKRAVLISAFCFSGIHAVNVFAGLPLLHVPIQLVVTCLVGIYFALAAIKLNNLIPLMIFHWLWDFYLMGSSTLELTTPRLTLVLIPLQVILALALWVKLKKSNT